MSVEAFRQRLHERMATLRHELMNCRYRTRPLLRLRLTKPGAKVRLLGIPTVRDRIVQSAAHQLLTPRVERVLKDCSYGYRPGRSHHQAIRQVDRERRQGFSWVVDGDIEAFFDNVDHALLLDRFRQLVWDPNMTALVSQWIAAPVVEQGTLHRRGRGLPQGAVISPILANLYLNAFDAALLNRDFRLVRFADDFVVLCRSRSQAKAALNAARHALDALNLHLNARKTSITSFRQGFRFLGARFRGNQVVSIKQSQTVSTAVPKTLLIPNETNAAVHLPVARAYR